jgi:hypothetical protein
MKKCEHCGSEYWDTPSGGKVTKAAVIEAELRYYRGLAKEKQC